MTSSTPPLRLALLGDSIAAGVGAALPEDALAPRLQRVLAEGGVSCEVVVHAVPGARSTGLRKQVREALEHPPALVLVVIGGNDLRHSVPIETSVDRLSEAVTQLRSAGARVLVAPAPDLSVVPLVPEEMREHVRATSLRLRDAQVRAVLAADGAVADASGESASAFAASAALFSSDFFHPSSAGYAVIAAAVAPALLAAARSLTSRST